MIMCVVCCSVWLELVHCAEFPLYSEWERSLNCDLPRGTLRNGYTGWMTKATPTLCMCLHVFDD